MKITLIILSIGLAVHGFVEAQSSDVIRIKGGIGGEKAVPIGSRYRYDQFLPGKILYQNGTISQARLNYNVLLGEMQFITSRGDTLALADEPLVRLVGVGTNGFLYDPKKGYLEILADYDPIKLALKYGLRLAKNEKLAAYGQSSGSSAITDYQFYSNGTTSVRNLDAQGDLVLIKSRTYMIIDQNGRSSPLNKANLLKIFSKHRDQVTTYLANNAVDFNQEDNLKKLLKYCSELL